MKTFVLLFLGVIVGWAASGVDWSREAVGEDEIVRGKRTVDLVDPNLANAEPSPQLNSAPTNGPRRVWETRMEVDANGQQRPVTVSRLVNADGTIVPETPSGLIGRFQATAYGSPSGHGCYVVDTMTGKTWHTIPNGQPPQVVTEALIQPAAQPATPVPTQAYGAPPLTARPASQVAKPEPDAAN